MYFSIMYIVLFHFNGFSSCKIHVIYRVLKN
jgi:hypothetical protein